MKKPAETSDTLFYPFTSGLVEYPAQASAVFMNAALHPFLKNLARDKLFLQHYFKPSVQMLERAGFTVSAELPDGKKYDLGFLLFPKNIAEGIFMMAETVNILSEGALFFCAADNKSAGSRLKKLLQQAGFTHLQEISKNKARVVWGQCPGALNEFLRQALEKGSLHKETHGFMTQPGLFSWNRIDKGSEILIAHLPQGLTGAGADFGCGYGTLAHFILQSQHNVTSLACIDADARALKACKENLQAFKDVNVKYIWADLTQTDGVPAALDWIVMNPPFHEAQRTDSATGQAFIRTAFSSLRPGGTLWMVANAHLPYEWALQQNFPAVNKIYEGKGFKVYSAVK